MGRMEIPGVAGARGSRKVSNLNGLLAKWWLLADCMVDANIDSYIDTVPTVAGSHMSLFRSAVPRLPRDESASPGEVCSMILSSTINALR
jgi:hypothetical protein